MNLKPPKTKKLIKEILDSDIQAAFAGSFFNPILGKATTQKIEQWKSSYEKEVKSNNTKSSIGKFNVFTTCLLLRSASGEAGDRLYNALEKNIKNYSDINSIKIKKVLKDAQYRFPPQGLKTILDFKELFSRKYDGKWDNYLEEAKRNYRSNYLEDEVLNIKGVGLKVRDLALSCFLKEYSANDIHVVRVLARTGLLLSGYGDVNIGTNPNNRENYLFLRKIIINLSDKSNYSPGEIDRIFWHFGRTICKKTPLCNSCPLKDICLTSNSKSKNSSK